MGSGHTKTSVKSELGLRIGLGFIGTEFPGKNSKPEVKLWNLVDLHSNS